MLWQDWAGRYGQAWAILTLLDQQGLGGVFDHFFTTIQKGENWWFSSIRPALWEIERWIQRPVDYHQESKKPRPIDSKLCQPIFNYLEFHAISHFGWCIQDHDSAVNYDTVHSEAAHKYLLKAFYNRTNKKEYDSQIRQHNVRHTNIIAMKDVIIEEKVREKEGLSEGIADTTAPAEVARASSPVDLAGKYMWAMSNADMDAAKELGLTGIKKYWRHAG